MALTTDDHVAIQQLYARYNHLIDSGKAGNWAATFTPDGVFNSGQGEFKGTDALAQFASGFAGQFKGKARHWTNNLVVDEAPGGASGTCYLALYRLGGEGGPKILVTGIYRDELVKGAGGWRFTKRVVAGDA
jgi:ketosteroid isomerase-like protein